MSFTCESCSKRKPGDPNVTVIGRKICDDCNRTTLGLAAGMTASGGSVGESVATGGWFRNTFRRRNRRLD